MNTLTLAKLLEKTDFYHHLDQISEELKMDYEEILDGLEEMADRGIHLNLDYLLGLPERHQTKEFFIRKTSWKVLQYLQQIHAKQTIPIPEVGGRG